MDARLAAQGLSEMAQNEGAALAQREVWADRLPGDQLLRRAETAAQARVARSGGSETGRDVRKAWHPDRGAEAPHGCRCGRGVRQCLCRDDVSGGARQVRRDLLSDLASDPRAS